MKFIAIIALLILGVVLWELQTLISFDDIKEFLSNSTDSLKALIN